MSHELAEAPDRTTESEAPLRPTLAAHRCPCGGTAGVDGECAECRSKRLSRRWTKAKGEGERDVPVPTDEISAAEVAGEEEEEEEEEAAEETPAGAEAAAAPASTAETAVPKAKILFRVVEAPPADGDGKRWCPAPRPARVGFTSPKRSSAAQIAAMGPCLWGITAPDPLKVRTTTCRDGASWRLRVTGVVSDIRTFSRQLPGQTTPTTANATAANFCGQVTDLDALGACGAGHFYMLSAVRAHEAVHVEEWKTSMGSDWPAQQAIIDGLNVPASGATRTRARATRAMRTSAAFTNAIQTSRASGNYPAFWGIADPNAQTDAAERVVVTPRIRQICAHARTRGWGPGACPVCAGLGIT